MDLQPNQKGTVQHGVTEVHVNGVQYDRSCKVEQMSLSKLCKVKQRRGWDCNFTRRTLLLLVATFATIVLIYNKHTCALIFIARRGSRRRGRVWVWRGGAYRCVSICWGSWPELRVRQHRDILGSHGRGGGYGCVFFLNLFSLLLDPFSPFSCASVCVMRSSGRTLFSSLHYI